MKATVSGQDSTEWNWSWDRVKNALELGFVVLVVVLIVLAIIVGFTLLRKKDEPDDLSGQTYY